MTEPFGTLEPIDPEAAAFSWAERMDALLEFPPRFEPDGTAADECMSEEGDGCLTDPAFDPSPELAAFEQALYGYGWIAEFDWPDWQDEATRLVGAPGALKTAGVGTLQKLFTSHLRKERFCEGHLAAMFECGHLAAALRRLKELREVVVEQTVRPSNVKRRRRARD